MSKAIRDFDGYSITEDGRVYSHVTEKWLKSRSSGSGYQAVMLYKNKIGKNFYVHRLVADAFLDKVDGKNCVNHIDGDKTNNCASNLEWVTPSENMFHANAIGLHTGSEKQKAAARENGKVMRKLTIEQVLEVKDMYASGMLQREIAEYFGMSQPQISSVLLGKVYKEAA